MTGNRVIFLVSFGMLGLGVIFSCIALGLTISSSHKKKVCTQEVSAVVTDLICKGSYDINHTYSESWFPVYEYRAGGRVIRVQSPVGGLETDYQAGERVTLLLNPDNPEEFYNPGDQRNMVRNVFWGVGIVLLAAGAAVGIFSPFRRM